jgi:hypothetical protein
VTSGAVSQQVDADDRIAGFPLEHLTEAKLRAGGLYAYSAIRAPRGLSERIVHVWCHEGVEVDRIALRIAGGRSEGYRAWSHKQAFPGKVLGKWRVEVRTDAGQLIGVIRFRVDPG